MLAISLLTAPHAVALADPPVAVIGAETISGDDYTTYLRGYLRSKLYHGGSPERMRELADEALDNLVTDRLLAREAIRRKIKGDRERVADRVAKLVERYSSQENWHEIKAQLPEIERKMLIETQIDVMKAEISKVAPPTEADLQAFYSARPDLFTQPPSWDLDLILFGLPPSALSDEWAETRAKADAAVAEIRAGQPFAELATQHSKHESAQQGGRLGQVHRGQLPDEAQTIIEKLPAGGVSDPIRLLEGYAILRVNGHAEAQLQPFDVIRERAAPLYQREMAAAQWSEFLRDLRARTHVETFDISSYVQRLLAGK